METNPMKKVILGALVTASLVGCATKMVNVTPSPVNGSKADGTIEMGYIEYAGTSSVVDWRASDALAAKKCKVWGYLKAERFGTFQNEDCQGFKSNVWTGALECSKKIVTVSYQCMN